MRYAVAFEEAWAPALAVREVGPAAAPKPRLLDRVRDAIRARHYSRRTEKSYVAWIRRYIFFHGKRHPALWRGPSSAGVRAPPREERRSRPEPDRGARGEGEQGPPDDAAGSHQGRSPAASRGCPRPASARSPGRRGLGRAAGRPREKVPQRGARMAVAVGLSGHSHLRGAPDRPTPPPSFA